MSSEMSKTEILNDSLPAPNTSGVIGTASDSHRKRTMAVIILSLAIASLANHLVAWWLKISWTPSDPMGIYRRVGPQDGPQVLAAGSSLLQSAMFWPRVSEALGEGIETWGVGGSSPEIWEQWQRRRPHSSTTIIGISVYDLNELHVADGRARFVPLAQTISDLRASHADPALAHRILTQYALQYVRKLFPTAGMADKVVEELRDKVAKLIGREASLAEHEGVVVEPPPPLLDAGNSTAAVSDWSSARLLRRMAALRSENRGRHEFFKGPKHMAFQRLLAQALRQGHVIVLVLPVTREYSEEFLDATTQAAFEKVIQEAMTSAPEATFVRLDRLPGISAPACFSDLVHMNSLGRRLSTQALLTELTRRGLQHSSENTTLASISGGM